VNEEQEKHWMKRIEIGPCCLTRLGVVRCDRVRSARRCSVKRRARSALEKARQGAPPDLPTAGMVSSRSSGSPAASSETWVPSPSTPSGTTSSG
jgi:hypothetical protein